MDYRLDGLSPRTFEHLVQALAFREITTEITPFGDGPDGGREAMFDGPTSYGSADARWAGYGVIQAKFRQRPGNRDGKWAEVELKKELSSYTSHGMGRRIPRYLIFATNVTLTAVQDRGGKDRILAILKAFTRRHSLAGFDIWDYDKLRVLLDNNEDVRNAYSAWILSGDVLAELAKQLKGRRPDYYKIMVNLLQKDLIADQYARLEQAGHSADEAIPLSQVFVDLPVANERVTEVEERIATQPTFHTEPGSKLQFANEMMRAARDRFINTEAGTQEVLGKTELEHGRYVLIGGPGQGKTTLGQLVCQLFRASLLADANRAIIDAPAQAALDEILTQWDSGRIPRPDARRLPFRVVLSEFAKKLAKGEVDSLIDYLAKYVAKRATLSFGSSDLKQLLLQYPSVLVLDGLDEVPPSTNREDVLASVRDFRIDIVTEQIDVLIIATSRPQGYNDDFSPRFYRHLYLVPLTPKIALMYARQLTQIRFGQDQARYDKVIGRLERASSAPATARLMRSPLQVTIMTLLVDRMGQPPQERWALFNEYYNLIYQREIERDIPAALVLRDYRSDIGAIHTRVGLILQIESERSGGTDSRLTTTQFSAVVKTYLSEEGHDGQELDDLQESIIEAAANRLVFLVGLEAGQVGFEIRSLQEFMAAEGLMEGEDATVQCRLRRIAPISNWRNVFLFAAGKCFSGRRHLRDTIGQICAELNDDLSDEVSSEILAGSRLALDLLEDGPAARQPIMSRTLTRLALRLLDSPAVDILNRLFAVYQERTSSLFVEVLSERIHSQFPSMANTAFASIARLADLTGSDIHGLSSVVPNVIDLENIHTVDLLIRLGDGRPGIVRELILSAVDSLPASTFIQNVLQHDVSVWEPRDESPQWLKSIQVVFRTGLGDSTGLRIPISTDSRKIGELVLRTSGSDTQLAGLLDVPSSNPDWSFTKAVVMFAQDPSSEKLLSALRLASRANLSIVSK